MSAPEEAIDPTTIFLAAGRTGVVRAEAIPPHPGKPTTVWQTRVTDEAGWLLSLTIQTQIGCSPDPQARPSAARSAVRNASGCSIGGSSAASSITWSGHP